MTQAIRIVIADDHPIVRQGLRALIETEPGMEVLAEAADGDEAVAQARDLHPDVMLLDLVMPGKDGLEAIREIKQHDPAARILVLTSFAEDDKMLPALKAGALGFLLKDSSPQTLLEGIRDVYRGEASLDPGVVRKLLDELNRPPPLPPTKNPLTPREAEVLALVGQGLSNEQIAAKLVITERTVRTHMSNILDKLQLANRTQAALYAVREGLTKPPLD